METRLLIDAVMRQTTLLIAQLATSAGLRAPLAHVADQVFFELAREIEQQGVSRKVAADMFGMALRTYQRKVNRLRESASFAERTLWQAVLECVGERGPSSRSQLLDVFSKDESQDVIAVLGDLVASGLLYSTGRGRHAIYGPTTRADRESLLKERSLDAVVHSVWLALAEPSGLTRAELVAREQLPEALLDEALSTLLADGRAFSDGAGPTEARYRTSHVMIPVGSEAGWEAAVLDHYRAVCTALVSKLRQGGAASAASALIGGTTLRFDLYPGHPYEQEVKGLLGRVRSDVMALWGRVAAFNKQHPVAEAQAERVVFYAGQSFVSNDGREEESP